MTPAVNLIPPVAATVARSNALADMMPATPGTGITRSFAEILDGKQTAAFGAANAGSLAIRTDPLAEVPAATKTRASFSMIEAPVSAASSVSQTVSEAAIQGSANPAATISMQLGESIDTVWESVPIPQSRDIAAPAPAVPNAAPSRARTEKLRNSPETSITANRRQSRDKAVAKDALPPTDVLTPAAIMPPVGQSVTETMTAVISLPGGTRVDEGLTWHNADTLRHVSPTREQSALPDAAAQSETAMNSHIGSLPMLSPPQATDAIETQATTTGTVANGTLGRELTPVAPPTVTAAPAAGVSPRTGVRAAQERPELPMAAPLAGTASFPHGADQPTVPSVKAADGATGVGLTSVAPLIVSTAPVATVFSQSVSMAARERPELVIAATQPGTDAPPQRDGRPILPPVQTTATVTPVSAPVAVISQPLASVHELRPARQPEPSENNQMDVATPVRGRPDDGGRDVVVGADEVDPVTAQREANETSSLPATQVAAITSPLEALTRPATGLAPHLSDAVSPQKSEATTTEAGPANPVAPPEKMPLAQPPAPATSSGTATSGPDDPPVRSDASRPPEATPALPDAAVATDLAVDATGVRPRATTKTGQDEASPLVTAVPPQATAQAVASPQAPQTLLSARRATPEVLTTVERDAPASPASQALPALLSLAAGKTGSAMVLRLDPAELGRLDIRIDRSPSGETSVHVTAERPETLALLVRDLPELHRALDQAGMPAEGRSVSLGLAATEPATLASTLPERSRSDTSSSAAGMPSPAHAVLQTNAAPPNRSDGTTTDAHGRAAMGGQGWGPGGDAASSSDHRRSGSSRPPVHRPSAGPDGPTPPRPRWTAATIDITA